MYIVINKRINKIYKEVIVVHIGLLATHRDYKQTVDIHRATVTYIISGIDQ